MPLISTLTTSGQVSIPEKILRQLRLEAGAELRCEVTGGGILLRPTPRASTDSPSGKRRKISGLLRHLAPDKPVSVEEMNQAVAEAAVERYERSSRR